MTALDWILAAIAGLTLAIVLGVLKSFVTTEVTWWIREAGRKLIALAARRLPLEVRPRWREEWLGEFDAKFPERPLTAMTWVVREVLVTAGRVGAEMRPVPQGERSGQRRERHGSPKSPPQASQRTSRGGQPGVIARNLLAQVVVAARNVFHDVSRPIALGAQRLGAMIVLLARLVGGSLRFSAGVAAGGRNLGWRASVAVWAALGPILTVGILSN